MKTVLLSENIYAEIMKCCSGHGAGFCVILPCYLVKLHGDGNLYSCEKSSETGTPCKLLIADGRESLSNAAVQGDVIEVISGENEAAYYEDVGGERVKGKVITGLVQKSVDEQFARAMKRLAASGKIIVCEGGKTYSGEQWKGFVKRSVLNLDAINSERVDIRWFPRCETLVQNLFYAGCRALTVFVPESAEGGAVRALKKVSKNAPFKNRLIIVISNGYCPATVPALLVGRARDVAGVRARAGVIPKVFFSTRADENARTVITIGANTTELSDGDEDCKIKPFAANYAAAIMSELILNAVCEEGAKNKKALFRVDGNTLHTKKEEVS